MSPAPSIFLSRAHQARTATVPLGPGIEAEPLSERDLMRTCPGSNHGHEASQPAGANAQRPPWAR
jgi:hypothetical protein